MALESVPHPCISLSSQLEHEKVKMLAKKRNQTTEYVAFTEKENKKNETSRWQKTPASNTSRWSWDQLTPDWPECLVASTSTGMCAVVLCVSSGWGAAKSEAWGAVHLRGGCLAAAAVAVAANATEGVLRRRARQTAARKNQDKHRKPSTKSYMLHTQANQGDWSLRFIKEMCVNSLVEALWWWCLAAIVVYFYWRMSVHVCIQTFGVSHMLQDPSSKVCQAAVFRQHQPGPGVTLCHIQGRDSNSTPHLMGNINLFTSERHHLFTWLLFCNYQMSNIKCIRIATIARRY